MNSSKNKALAFKGVMTLFTVALFATLFFTGCPGTQGNGGGDTESKENGVWEVVSITNVRLGHTQKMPVTNFDKSKRYLYFCFADSKIYKAVKDEGTKGGAKDGLFGEKMWEIAYSIENGVMKLEDENSSSIIFKINGDEATMDINEDGENMQMKLKRVSSPVVATFQELREDGVWIAELLATEGEANKEFPEKDSVTNVETQPYMCFSERKMYQAVKVSGHKGSEASKNGFFKGDPWGVEYILDNDEKLIKPTGKDDIKVISKIDKIIIKMKKGSKDSSVTLRRVKSPTAEEIKAAKES